MLFFSLYAMYKAINSQPEDTSSIKKLIILISCIFGAVFLTVGSIIGFATAWSSKKSISRDITRPEESLKRLGKNEKVTWLIRIIPRKYDERNLRLSRLNKIGRDEQKFTFVADYDEMRGRTAAEAVRMFGLNIDSTYKVSAIIFPVDGRKLYPVNARGLLQVIAKVESDPVITEKFFVDRALHEDDYRALNINKPSESPVAYAWNNYKDRYYNYCQAVQNFRCSPRDQVAKMIGDISEDWHPLGFSRTQPLQNNEPCKQTSQFCSISDWDKDTPSLVKEFGARVFLTENIEINSIRNRIMIDFDDPQNGKIPNLYLEDN